MCTEQRDSIIKKALKSLCSNNGWSYGVFWRFDPRNSLLLTMQDAYYEEQMGDVINHMLLQVHMLGEGLIGQAAFTKKHQWMFSDVHYKGQNPIRSNQDIFQDDSEFQHQFASGIKTIAVIAVEPGGVVQFGSTNKILERTEFVNQTKRLYLEMEIGEGLFLPENAPSSSNRESYGPSGLFASLISPGNSYILDLESVHGASCQDMRGTDCSSKNPTQSFSFTSDHRRMTPLIRNSSHINNQLQIAGAEAQVLLSNKSNAQLQQPFLPSTTYFNCSAAQTPCSSTWSCGDSTLTSFKQPPSEMWAQDSQNVFSAKPNSLVSCRNTVQNFQDSTFTSFNSTGELLDVENELFQVVDCTAALSKSCRVDDFSQWFARSPDQSNGTLGIALNDDLLSQAMGLSSVTSNFNGGDNPMNIPVIHPSNSVPSSIANTLNSDGKEKCSNIFKDENNLFDSFGVDFGFGKAGDWDDILMPVVNGNHLDLSTDTAECLSEQHVGSKFGPHKGLFSKLGIEQLLDGISGTSNTLARYSFEDQLSSSTKRRRTGSSLGSSDQVPLVGLPCFSGNLNSLQPVYKMDMTNNPRCKKQVLPKSEASSRIGESYSMNTGTTVSEPKTHVEPAKATKRKAKPGARPRPKDRQQIQDRVAELRELIPNGEKMSIDCLLDRTIKHMIFLQGVTKHADRLKQVDEPKENGVVQKDNSSSSGVTWACEFGDQTMVCPLIVEDLSTHGQMLIEMLCEEQGFFLEIGDIIRGFGLTILKGVMEVRENKIWARFIVEAERSRHVTRREVFSTLIQLLQLTAPGGVNVSDQPGNVVDGGTTLLNTFQQSVVPFPVSLPETIWCTSL